MSRPAAGRLPGVAGRAAVAPAARRRRQRLAWLALLGVAVAWSLAGTGAGGRPVLNLGGWPVAEEFVAAAARPATDPAFLRIVADACLVTMSFAVLGAALAVALGLAGAFAASQTFWRLDRARHRPGWLAARGAVALPRGLHEAVWGVALVNVLGLDPLVGILAIGIPFGAMTAKVFADLVDEAPHSAYQAILACGGGRGRAFAYGLLPLVGADMLSYAFYRLECSIRSAVVLGIIGAGGLGFQLALSFQSLNHDELWTVIYALVALCGLTDAVGVRVRRRLDRPGRSVRWSCEAVEGGAGAPPAPLPGNRLLVPSVLLVALLAALAWAYLEVSPQGLWSQRSRAQLALIGQQAWPPRLDGAAVPDLAARSLETLQMSVLAMALSTAAGMAVAGVAARPRGALVSRARQATAWSARAALLLCRAIPPPVWALALLFVLVPGPLPGALALAAYNVGILGRLMAEAVENLDDRPARAVEAQGATRMQSWLYATWPQTVPRFLAFGLYRWEVAVRETVVVGLVGAGGLGRLLGEQMAAFDWPGITATVAALVLLTFAVDLISSAARRAAR